jgi:sugar/nucleoside kinase (ribokinase family)
LALLPLLGVMVWRARRRGRVQAGGLAPADSRGPPTTTALGAADSAESSRRDAPRPHARDRQSLEHAREMQSLQRSSSDLDGLFLQPVETADDSRAALGLRGAFTPDHGAPLVLVFGSLNMDLHAETEGFPSVGSNTKGLFSNSPGGKGANEAVGIAQLGIRTALIGRAGTDPMGDLLIGQLPLWRVDVSGVERDASSPTGVAVIVKSAREKQKLTISCQGANSLVGDAELRTLRARLPGCAALVLQLEVRREAVAAAAELGRAAGKMVVLKASPCATPSDVPARLLRNIEMLFANDFEASVLVGAPTPLRELADAVRAGEELCSGLGIRVVVITTPVAHLVTTSGGGGGGFAGAARFASGGGGGGGGGDGCGGGDGGEGEAASAARTFVVPSFRVDMGAGSVIGAADAFVAALVASTIRGCSLEAAAVRASCAEFQSRLAPAPSRRPRRARGTRCRRRSSSRPSCATTSASAPRRAAAST